MIFLFTDFGYRGPYVGQMKAVLAQSLPDRKVIDLMHDAPRFNAKASSYLLAALCRYLPQRAITVAVVDPGVGSDRRPLAVRAGDRWFIGPDNGLLDIPQRRADSVALYEIDWAPGNLSASFHGRDLFAPVAAEIARGRTDHLQPLHPETQPSLVDWPDDLAEVIYADEFGNAMTGVRFSRLPQPCDIFVGDTRIPLATTFSDVDAGAPLAYKNSLGLLEIAVNQGNACELLHLDVGTSITITASEPTEP